ncbi:MAG: hypothetical protein DMG82_21455 [Acidobacteria bacterium]|nr:MAG: hypothetical protein DMG82_21455 [Acidobacteriota bacterium]
MRKLISVLAVSLFVVLLACNKQHQAPKESSNPLDRIDSSHQKPINFLHKTFTVKKSAQFSIEVPAHTVIPRVHGTFKSFVPRSGDDPLSDDSTDVGFLLNSSPTFLTAMAEARRSTTSKLPTITRWNSFSLPAKTILKSITSSL